MKCGYSIPVFNIILIFSISIFLFGAKEVKMADNERIILNFDKSDDSNNWIVINDVVMGESLIAAFSLPKRAQVYFQVLSHWKITAVLPRQT